MKKFQYPLFAGICAAAISASAPAQAQSGTAFIAQVAPFAGSYCPRDWADASGTLLPIAQYQALFSLVGTFYGGDGRTTFALPDLRGRVPVSQGNVSGLGSFPIGSKGGSVEFTLNQTQLPSHTHTGTIAGDPNDANTNAAARNNFAKSVGTNAYVSGAVAENNMRPGQLRIQPTGNNLSVSKVSPYQTIRWCIALNGIYPSRS